MIIWCFIVTASDLKGYGNKLSVQLNGNEIKPVKNKIF